MIPSAITEAVLSALGDPSMAVTAAFPLGGGCINEAYRLETSKGTYFLKYNRATRYPWMFETEERGLRLLREVGGVRAPEPLMTGPAGDYTFILMEYLEAGKENPGFWEAFGRGLARLHRRSNDQFGLDHDNYIGSLPQSNKFHPDWTGFFIMERLMPLVGMAADSRQLHARTVAAFDRLYRRLPDIFPEEPPALLHGDLWNGNYLTGPSGEACLIDPAVYYGNREMDLAMSRLFGGFSPVFYEAYHEEFPLLPGWKARADICNLYPLLVHVNLFGGGYARSVEGIVQRF